MAGRGVGSSSVKSMTSVGRGRLGGRGMAGRRVRGLPINSFWNSHWQSGLGLRLGRFSLFSACWSEALCRNASTVTLETVKGGVDDGKDEDGPSRKSTPNIPIWNALITIWLTRSLAKVMRGHVTSLGVEREPCCELWHCGSFLTYSSCPCCGQRGTDTDDSTP